VTRCEHSSRRSHSKRGHSTASAAVSSPAVASKVTGSGGRAAMQRARASSLRLSVLDRVGLSRPRSASPSQPVHPERVLGGGVGEHHVGVVEHVQPVQGQRVDLQLVQRELRVRVEAHVPHAGQRGGQLFGEAGRRLPCDWDTRHQRTCRGRVEDV